MMSLKNIEKFNLYAFNEEGIKFNKASSVAFC